MSIIPKEATKKLLDCYIHSFSRIQSQEAFEKCMDFLCEVNGPVDLGAGIQVLKSESFATPVLQFDEIKEEPLDMLFQAYQESVSRPETNINEADGHLAIEINYNESRIECLESELKEKKDKLREVISKSQVVIKSLLDSSPKHRKNSRFSPEFMKQISLFSLAEEEESSLQSTTRGIKDTYQEHEKNKLEAIRGHFKNSPSVISIGDLMGEDRPLDQTAPSLKSSIIPSPRDYGAPPTTSSLSVRSDHRKSSLIQSAARNAFISSIQAKISQMTKYIIHVSSLSVIIALFIFSLSAIITRVGLDNSDFSKIEIVDHATCAEVDPAIFMSDIEYVQGPSLTALSMIALVISITNYGLRIALENLKGKYSSKWLWAFPLIACVLEMVAVLLMFKGKNALSDLQKNLFKLTSMNCLKNPTSAAGIFDHLVGIFGQQFMFTVVGAILSIYQLIFYLSNVFVIEFMQSLK